MVKTFEAVIDPGRVWGESFTTLLFTYNTTSLPFRNSNVTIATVNQNGTNYIRTTCNQSNSTPGVYPIGGNIPVTPNESYTFRVKGYKTLVGNARVYVMTTGGQAS